jgi:hypothetical protein
MAVVQISRIQVRRGRINSGTGLPQLASGEMAWAIDSQELYIGNGAVSEGSPAVGNTKVLTQKDLETQFNILNTIKHIYHATDSSITTGPTANNPTTRLLQDKLDDLVSAYDFGVTGNGVADDTVALQRAINQLFLNPTTKSSGTSVIAKRTRVTLALQPGVYNISSTLYVPAYASIVGAGSDKTFIYYNPVSTVTGATTNGQNILTTTGATARMVGALITGNGIPAGASIVSVVAGVSVTLSANATVTQTAVAFTVTLTRSAVEFVNDTSTIGNPSLIATTTNTNQPRGIQLEGMTIHAPTGKNGCLTLNCVKDSKFVDLNLQGDWAGVVNTKNIGIALNSLSSLVTCSANLFKDIRFVNFTYAVYAKQDIIDNTFENCFFDNGYQSFVLGEGVNPLLNIVGSLYGPRNTNIINCRFNNIKRHAVYLDVGTNNTTRNCIYKNVGNDGGTDSLSAVYPQIYFATHGNASVSDISDRHGEMATSLNLTVKYVPEYAGHGSYTPQTFKRITLGYRTTADLAFRLPCSTDSFGVPVESILHHIDYFYKSTAQNFTRQGTIKIVADVINAKIQLSDEYNFAGTDPSGSNQMLLDFTAKFLDATGAVYTGAAGQVPSSIGIYYTNLAWGSQTDQGYFNYSYSSIL